jgi:5-methylcytosine-specific restriction enzyme subunit McrC
MADCLTILEYGYLRRARTAAPDGAARLSAGDFEALKALLTEEPLDDQEGADEIEHHRLFRLCNVRGEEALQVRNFVGVIEAPSGLQIEVLPKIGGSHDKAREILLRMLRATSGIPAQAGYVASLRPVSLPLIEVFIREFLEAVNHLLKRGLVSGYQRQQRNQHFLKGRLLLSRHLRHNVARADRFYVEYDQFLMDRAENRLIRSALEVVIHLSRDSTNQRLCREFLFAFDDVPVSRNVRMDFDLCVKDRGLSHYSTALMWARLVLLRLTPLGRQGKARVRALLFPMERLFEKYVGIGLRRQFRNPYTLREQGGKRSLVSHKGNDYFKLRPDFLVERFRVPRHVLDAKWKLIDTDQSGADKKYGISQADLYQLYAYGHKYLGTEGKDKVVCLIYPMTAEFKLPLAPFEYEPGHRLLVLPFDLDGCQLIGADELIGASSDQ